jgi:hypothetical protein
MKPTHILVLYKSQKSSMLFRAEDGMLVCMHQKAVVVYGDSPKDKNSHTFIDEPSAGAWLKDVYPAKDLELQSKLGEPLLEIRDGEGTDLWLPEDSLEMPGFGPHMRKTN